MSLSRRLLLVAPWVIVATSARAAAAGTPASIVERFYDTLLAVMKEAKRLSFDERYRRLTPPVTQTFDLGFMTRVAVGQVWAQLTAGVQQRLSDAFSRYTVSVYANRFDDWSGERFEVSPQETSNPNGVVVDSRLVKGNGEKVTLKYLLRQDGAGNWKVIDVYLSGTVSELATRRAEFAAVLQKSGPEGLVEMIEQRIAALRAG